MKIDLSAKEKKYLQEALSFTEAEKYIKKFNNKIFVIKYGGSALSNRYLANNFAKDLVLIKKLGINLVVVHGGGAQTRTLRDETYHFVKAQLGALKKHTKYQNTYFINILDKSIEFAWIAVLISCILSSIISYIWMHIYIKKIKII